jgi:uncharacterized protein YmfQ (DUF2313 family)
LIIEQRTQQEQARIIGNYLRNDKLHEAKNNPESNFFKILLGLSVGWLEIRNSAKQIIDNYNINNSLLLIEEWEKAVGIPDEIFDIAADIETRRKNILLKIAGSRATTDVQFERIAQILGFNINVVDGFTASSFTYKFPILLLSEATRPFAIVVEVDKKYKTEGFPFVFTFNFSIDLLGVLKQLFDKIKPAHCKVFFNYV